jgi:hypothetical protein
MFDRWVRVHGKPMEVELPTKREWETRQRGGPTEAAKLTARETTKRATLEPRPEDEVDRTTARRKAAALEWPKEEWLKSDEKAFHRDHGIIAYLRAGEPRVGTGLKGPC